jgi:molybdate transport system substrate-binding protein
MRQVMSARWNCVTQRYLYALMSDKRRSRFILLPILIAVLLTLWGGTAGANERVVQVAAAADLKFALDEIIESFQRQHQDIKARVTYGSSGNFFAQLSNRAPFDIYFSADVDYPRKLIEQGLAFKETEFLYAVGRIVVWAPRRSILGENIAQTAQFIQTGAADIGIIALGLALAPALRDEGQYWEVPLDTYPRMDQSGVILTWAKDMAAAQALRAFVLGPEGKDILRRYGFFLPGK